MKGSAPLLPFEAWRRRRFEEGSRGDKALQRIKERSRWTAAVFVKQHPYCRRGMRRRRPS